MTYKFIEHVLSLSPAQQKLELVFYDDISQLHDVVKFLIEEELVLIEKWGQERYKNNLKLFGRGIIRNINLLNPDNWENEDNKKKILYIFGTITDAQLFYIQDEIPEVYTIWYSILDDPTIDYHKKFEDNPKLLYQDLSVYLEMSEKQTFENKLSQIRSDEKKPRKSNKKESKTGSPRRKKR